MTPSIQPKDATLGAVVTNIDLAHLNDATWSIVEDAFIEYGVLIFPNQHLTDDEQVAFASRFGELEIVLSHISNARSDHTVIGDDELRYWILRGNELAHRQLVQTPVSQGLLPHGNHRDRRRGRHAVGRHACRLRCAR